MSYNVQLADRIRQYFAATPEVTERQMFGGLAFLIDGNMAVAANRSGGLMIRVNPGETEGFLSTTSAHRVEMGGRKMRGWLAIEADYLADETDLSQWLDLAKDHVATLSGKGSGSR